MSCAAEVRLVRLSFHSSYAHKRGKLVEFLKMPWVEALKFFCRLWLNQLINVKAVVGQGQKVFAQRSSVRIDFNRYAKPFPYTAHIFYGKILGRTEKRKVKEWMVG